MKSSIQKLLKDFLEEYKELQKKDEWQRSCDGSYGRNQIQFLIEKYEKQLCNLPFACFTTPLLKHQDKSSH